MAEIKKVGALFKPTSQGLSRILEKIEKINNLNQILISHLPESMQSYCHAIHYNNQELHILTANSSVATTLRYQSPTLIAQLKNHSELCHLMRLVIRVSPQLSQRISRFSQYKEQRKMQSLSPQTAKVVQDIAESINDPKLSKIMNRIAAHVKQNEDKG